MLKSEREGRAIRLCVVALACALLCLASPAAIAQPNMLGQAEAAWHQGELEKAQKLYEQALSNGGLEPKDVVVAYSRIGTVKAALRDSGGALSAFRTAATIDPKFELPADSGPVAKKLYAQARQEAEQQGEKLSLTLGAPDNTPAHQAFTVETTIPAGFAVLVSQVVVTVEDPLTGKKWQKKKAAEPSLSFDFPKSVAVPGAHMKIHARAVDGQNNAWAAAEATVKVDGTRDIATMDDGEVTPFDDQKPQKKDKPSGGIFKGPLPWIVGGALIVGGIIVYAVTRPSKDVTVGAPSWQ